MLTLGAMALEINYGTAVQQDGRILAASYYGESSHNIHLRRLNFDGSLDSSFDNDGLVVIDLGAQLRVYSTLVQPDGKIVIAGSIYDDVNGQGLLLMRFNTDGTPDASFGDGDGMAVLYASSMWLPGVKVVIQHDGKLVVAGSWNSIMFLARFTSDGSLDDDFGTNGWTTYASTGNGYSVTGCALQADGAIVLCGAVMEGGGSYEDMVVVRFTANGTLDTTFDGDGIVSLPVSSSIDVAEDVLIQPDGHILLSVAVVNGQDFDFGLVRLLPNGALDPSFDSDGVVITTWHPLYDSPSRMAMQPDGKILQSGTVHGEFAVARHNADGSVDTSFGTSGLATADPSGGDWDRVRDMALASDGRIVVVGEAPAVGGGVGVARFLNDTDVGVPTTELEGFARVLYPNPASEHAILEYELPRAATLSCELLDDRGRKVKEIFTTRRSAGRHREMLVLNDLEAGTYTVLLNNSEGRSTSFRIVKE